MRQQSLRQTANRYLKTDNRSSFKDKRHRNYVIHKMIDGLFIIGEVPVCWQALTTAQIHKLVQHWQKRRISIATIMRYMTIIRKFLKDMSCPATNISNNALCLARTIKPTIKPKIYPGFWQQIANPSTRILTAMQIHFGLTLREAMNLIPDLHIQENTLWITREIAFNSLDRMIPFRNSIQENILSELRALTGNSHSLIDIKGYSELRYSYRQSLSELSFKTTKNYRYLYARQLRNQLAKHISQYEIKFIIMEEMGIQSRTTLWSYLNEQ